MEIGIAIGALIAALAPLVAMYFTLRQTRDVRTEERARRSFDRLDALERENADLKEENYRLLRELWACREEKAK